MANDFSKITIDGTTYNVKTPNKLTVGSKTFDGSSAITIDASDLGLSNALQFVGETTTALSDGSTTSSIKIGSTTHTATTGDVVLYGTKEFVWQGSMWKELGDGSSHALKTISISAGSGLTGGGTLESNRTISHADTSSQTSVSASGRRYITGVTLDDYGHVTGLTTGTETVTAPTVNNGTLTIQKNGTSVGTFTANQSGNTTANITVPTKVSELTNDSGFKTTDNNTTYSLSKSGSTITLTGSDGSTTSVTDANTTYSVPVNATTSAVAPSACTSNGFYYVSSSTNSLTDKDGNPFLQYHTSNNDFRILATAYSASWIQQIATDFRSEHAYIRRCENGTWKPWTKIAQTSEIPSVSNSTITIKQTGIADQTFTLNGGAKTITLADTNTQAVSSVNSKTGAVSLGASDVGALSSSGGNVSGHIYLTGSKESSSTGNTSQIVFGTSSSNHVAVSSNKNALVINPTTSTTTNQIVLYLDKASVFPKGISGNASSATNATKLNGQEASYYAKASDIPTVGNGTLTITENGTSKGTFTANQSGNTTIALTNTTYSNATTSVAGLMSKDDKAKLDGIATGANAYTLPSATSSALGGIKISFSNGVLTITT